MNNLACLADRAIISLWPVGSLGPELERASGYNGEKPGDDVIDGRYKRGHRVVVVVVVVNDN